MLYVAVAPALLTAPWSMLTSKGGTHAQQAAVIGPNLKEQIRFCLFSWVMSRRVLTSTPH